MTHKFARITVSALHFFLFFFVFAQAKNLVEPHLTIKPGAKHGPYVALTFDACMGRVDERILQALIDNHIRATIFATARWLKYNAKAIEEIKAHPDLFEVEDHGAMHMPAVDVPMRVFGLAAAGSPQGVHNEVMGGADAVAKAFGHQPRWFRGATGMYSASSLKQIEALHLKVAGYSVLGDGGASFSTQKTAATIGKAKDGDVIVAHINQPKKPAGLGVVEGILKLKAAGFIFLRLEDGV
jgi:peptidoglycan/xylan/chitin deacetylase (PgdA/CDA1 family)